MQSYQSDEGLLTKAQFKGIGSEILQGILERHNLNQTEEQIQLANIIGKSISSRRDLHNQSRS